MYIICLSVLENYEYVVHKLWWVQYLERKEQPQDGENCMATFTIKLSSPTDYGDQVNQMETGWAYITL
jgi:hypothetical protein